MVWLLLDCLKLLLARHIGLKASHTHDTGACAQCISCGEIYLHAPYKKEVRGWEFQLVGFVQVKHPVLALSRGRDLSGSTGAWTRDLCCSIGLPLRSRRLWPVLSRRAVTLYGLQRGEGILQTRGGILRVWCQRVLSSLTVCGHLEVHRIPWQDPLGQSELGISGLDNTV